MSRANLIFPAFGRLAPVLKVRTLLRKRAAGELAAPGSPANILCIADNLALGWLDEEVRLRRQAAQFLVEAESQVERAVADTKALFAEYKVQGEGALKFFTLLDSIRTDVREAAVRVALACLAVCIFSAACGGADMARRSARRSSRRPSALVCLLDGETEDGVL